MAYKGRLKTFQTAFAKPQPAAFVQTGIWFDANQTILMMCCAVFV